VGGVGAAELGVAAVGAALPAARAADPAQPAAGVPLGPVGDHRVNFAIGRQAVSAAAWRP
jgi:hypothetical protein